MKTTVLKMTALAALTLLGATAAFAAAEYDVDQNHSRVGFKVKHLVVSKVEGNFKDFSGHFTFDPKDLGASKVKFTIKAASINTNTDKRDAHLRSPDFFDVKKYPTLSFESTGVEADGEGKYKLNGNLTLHGTTKPVTFNVEFGGIQKDPWGKTHSGFSATTRINRKDYGLTWNKALEAGGFVVGEDVDISVDIEGVLKEDAKSKS